MTQFWLDNLGDLFSTDNFDLSDDDSNVKKYNLVSLIVIVVGITLFYKTKKSHYLGYTVLGLSIIIFVKSTNESFSNIDKFSEVVSNELVSNKFFLSSKLIKDARAGTNQLFLTDSFNIKVGDIIMLDNTIKNEPVIITNISISTENNLPIVGLKNNLQNNFVATETKLFKVSDTGSNVLSPPDGNRSILESKSNNIPKTNTVTNYNNGNRTDSNLELATYKAPGESNYVYQGPPDGPLKCRNSTINNPMGTVNMLEYDAEPNMYGTCNIENTSVLPDGRTVNNDYLMTDNMESTVSMRVDDLLFHRGNAQSRFSPMSVDTIPNNQEAFAHFCYRHPTNLINPKYASIFVNDPKKLKLLTQLAKATGTENGGGGGGGGAGR